MKKSQKIRSIYGTCLMGIDKHRSGYWDNHGNSDNGWLGYLIVFGIFIVSFFILIVIK